jgi:hypothetical protein
MKNKQKMHANTHLCRYVHLNNKILSKRGQWTKKVDCVQSQPLNNKSQLKGQRYNELRRDGFNTTLHQRKLQMSGFIVTYTTKM